MVSTKVKCDGDYHRYGVKEELITSEAIGAQWYEIEIHPAMITWRQPKTADSFKDGCSHACSPEHAVEIIAAVLDEQIMKVAPKEEAAAEESL